MRVVVVSDFGDVNGGAAKVAILSSRGLAERGVPVVFVYGSGPLHSDLHHPAITLHCLQQPDVWSRKNKAAAAVQGIWNRAAQRQMGAILEAERPGETIIHFHQWSKSLSPSVLASALSAGFVCLVSMHDFFLACPTGAYFDFSSHEPCRLRPMSRQCLLANCDSRGRRFKAVRLLRHRALQNVLSAGVGRLGVVHVSPFVETIGRRLLPTSTPQFVVPNPVVMDRGDPVRVRDQRAFAFIGRFTREKDPVGFAAAAREADCRAVFLGDGPERAAIQRANPEAVILPWGSQSAVRRVLGTARAVVFPSRWYETSGLVVAEALSCGVPAIVSRITAARDLVVEGRNGLLIPPGDRGALVDALRRLQDDGTAERMGRSAYELYWRSPLSLAAHLDRLSAAYRAMLASAHARAPLPNGAVSRPMRFEAEPRP